MRDLIEKLDRLQHQYDSKVLTKYQFHTQVLYIINTFTNQLQHENIIALIQLFKDRGWDYFRQ